MKQLHSSYKNSKSFWKYLYSMLLLVTALLFMNPITTYADLDYGGGGEGHYVGSLFWGGSTSRTGFLFYIVKDGAVLTAADLGLGGPDDKFAVELIHEADYNTFQLTKNQKHPGGTETVNSYYRTHFGFLRPNKTLRWDAPGMPYPVYYNESNCTWSSNEEAVKEWLFSDSPIEGKLVWEYIVRFGFGADALEKLKTMAGEELTLCLEPISCQAIYGRETWTEDEWNAFLGKNYHPEAADNDYIKFVSSEWGGNAVGKPRPLMNEYGHVRRVLATGMYTARINAMLIDGAPQQGLSVGGSGGANAKWTNEAMPFCMMITEEHLGIQPMNANANIISTSEIFGEKKGYAIAMFTTELQANFISTYDIVNTPSTPAPAEPPSEEKQTDGECTIIKVYADITIDSATQTKTVTDAGTYRRTQTTNSILLQDEEAATGYKLVAAYQTKDSVGAINGVNFYEKIGNNRTIFASGKAGNKGILLAGYKYLYVYYTKTTILPSPEIEAYDFEIPESYITKQVYFSQANNTSNTDPDAQSLIQHTFEWLSEAHTQCPGHTIITCQTPEHTHKPYIDATNPGCYALSTSSSWKYTCSGDQDYCSKYHTYHSEANCKKVTGYKCTKCNATASTKSSLRHTGNRCTSNSVKAVYGDFIKSTPLNFLLKHII